ncbi:hypothetical protein [Cytobacillus firmus]|uniref:hypothetical protein n=1 Tax=Cytobacillus firmus TaxID=1399 RepID=UPI001C8EA7DB|nr:hypothetical protein [Cytobacillus firmus]MBX9975115.1 hypothetical protein [Cytobacillus firmus]
MSSPPGMHEAFYKYQEAYEYRLLSWKSEVYLTREWWLGGINNITLDSMVHFSQ